MNTDSKRKIAYNLTLEYVKQNNIMKVNMDSNIPKSIDTIEKIYNEIYNSLEGKNILQWSIFKFANNMQEKATNFWKSDMFISDELYNLI